MRRNARRVITAKIVRRNVAATIIHRVMHKVAFACAIKAGPVQIAQNRVQKASMVSVARKSVRMLCSGIKHAITSQANTFAVPATLV